MSEPITNIVCKTLPLYWHFEGHMLDTNRYSRIYKQGAHTLPLMSLNKHSCGHMNFISKVSMGCTGFHQVQRKILTQPWLLTRKWADHEGIIGIENINAHTESQKIWPHLIGQLQSNTPLKPWIKWHGSHCHINNSSSFYKQNGPGGVGWGSRAYIFIVTPPTPPPLYYTKGSRLSYTPHQSHSTPSYIQQKEERVSAGTCGWSSEPAG